MEGGVAPRVQVVDGHRDGRVVHLLLEYDAACEGLVMLLDELHVRRGIVARSDAESGRRRRWDEKMAEQ